MTPEESKNYHQAYYYTNRAIIKEKARIRYEVNREKILNHNRDYYKNKCLTDPEFIRHKNLKCKEYQKEYQKRNKKGSQGKLEVKKGKFIISMN